MSFILLTVVCVSHAGMLLVYIGHVERVSVRFAEVVYVHICMVYLCVCVCDRRAWRSC